MAEVVRRNQGDLSQVSRILHFTADQNSSLASFWLLGNRDTGTYDPRTGEEMWLGRGTPLDLVEI